MIDWLIDANLSSRHEKLTAALFCKRIESAQELTIFQVFRLAFDFLPTHLAACSKSPKREAPDSRTQQRDQ